MKELKSIIHKKGSIIKIPIKYDFNYSVKTPNGYEKPICRQDNFYNEDIIEVIFENGIILGMTKDHRHDIVEDNIHKEILSINLKEGMYSEDINRKLQKIIKINKKNYSGIAVDFTMPNDVFYANGILTRNCRLRLDLRQLTRKNGSLFGAGDNTGSIGVVTLNLPKIGYLSHTKEELFARIEALMITAKNALEQKRTKLNEWFDKGLYPYTKRYLKDKYNNHFSTIGLVGMNELCRNYFRNTKKKDWDISTKEGTALCIEILNFMRDKCSDFQEQTGNLYNLESTPAESTAYRLASHDKKKYPDIITAGTIQNPYYTNSSNLPVNYSDNPWDAIEHQEKIQPLYTGGTVLHTYLDESIEDWQKIKTYLKKVMFNTKLPYITLSPTFSHCQIHGFIKGNTGGICPMCKEEAMTSYQEHLSILEEKKRKILEEAEQNTCCENSNG